MRYLGKKTFWEHGQAVPVPPVAAVVRVPVRGGEFQITSYKTDADPEAQRGRFLRVLTELEKIDREKPGAWEQEEGRRLCKRMGGSGKADCGCGLGGKVRL